MSTEAGQFLDYKKLFYTTRNMVQEAGEQVDALQREIEEKDSLIRRLRARLLRAHTAGFCAESGDYCEFCEAEGG